MTFATSRSTICTRSGFAIRFESLTQVRVEGLVGGEVRISTTGIPADATEIVRGTLGGASAVAHRLGDPIGTELLSAARDAFTQAFVVTAAVNALIVLATAIAATLALRHTRNVRGAREPSAV